MASLLFSQGVDPKALKPFAPRWRIALRARPAFSDPEDFWGWLSPQNFCFRYLGPLDAVPLLLHLEQEQEALDDVPQDDPRGVQEP
jgi:hypothetical protein